MNGNGVERIDTIVIGGGQSGLAVGVLLAKRGMPFVILDAGRETGDAWRNRWDSLRLFTPARLNGLPGMAFTGPGDATVNKDQMADFLQSYAATFGLPIRHNVCVQRLDVDEGTYLLETSAGRMAAQNVVVAMSNYQKAKIPEFATELDPDIVQLHASDYRNPSQLGAGRVLVVGAGNSGADIAIELSGTHQTFLAGKETGHVPFRIEGRFGRWLGIRLVRFVGHHILNTGTPVGRKVRLQFQRHAGPLVRVKPDDLTHAGVRRIGRVVGVRGGMPVLEGQREPLAVSNVVWCTGYRTGFSWIRIPVLDEHDEPDHDRGIAIGSPGLYFVGLNFLFAATSDVVTGLARDAAHVVRDIAAQ